MENTLQIHAPNAEEAANPLPRASDFGPNYGLLSECLATSPVIQTIWSASVRCDTDDPYVIFVGERHIELRSLTERLNLELLATKSDFFCKIRSAELLDIKKASSSSFLDKIKQEDDAPFLYPAAASSSKIPKQVLVVTLESGDLGFIYVDVTPRGKLDFVVATHRISPEQSKIGHVGKSISVDFHSRAMAICAWEGSFKLYETHDATTMEQTVAAGKSFIPLRREKTFHVPGTILHLEFLRANDPDHVVFLVFYVNKQKQMRLLLYEWDTKQPLCKAAQLGQEGLRLPEKWGLPVHVVPLTIATYFAIICKQAIYIGRASDIVSGNCKWRGFPVPTAVPGDVKLVTAWARPHRNPSYAERNDDFYIVKENGELFWLYVNNSQSNYGPNIEAVQSGKLVGAVGSAFAFHEVPTESSCDLLVAAGEASSGGTYLITPMRPMMKDKQLQEPLFIQEIFNWAPSFDAGILNMRGSNDGNLVPSRGRLYVTAGSDEHGTVAELRQGLECRPAAEIDYQEPVTKLIPLPGSSGRGCFLLLCLVLGTSIWYLPYETLSPSDVGDTISLRTGETSQTITAGVFDELCIQATTDGIYATALNESDIGAEVQIPTVRREWNCPLGHSIVCAALREDNVILAMKSPAGYQLWNMALQGVTETDKMGLVSQRGEPIALPSQPTCFEFLDIGKWTYLVVENTGITLDLYELGGSGDLKLRTQLSTSIVVDEENDPASTQAQLPVCESVRVLESEGKTFLICGLRNGYVLYGGLDPEALTFNPLGRVKIGRMPVLLLVKEGQSDRVLAQSTHSLHQLTIENSVLVVTPIVFNQTIEPAISAVCHLDHDFRSTQFPDPIICATESSILVGMLGRLPSFCTRQLAVKESPSKLLYIEKENTLAVVCQRPNPENYIMEDGKVAPRSTILFLDPRSGEPQSARDLRDAKYGELIFNKRLEKIHCICNWEFPDPSLTWTCILVGTSYQAAPDQPRKGRVLVLSIRYNGTGNERRLEIRKRNQVSCVEPVYSLATYGEGSMIFGAERSLYKIDLVQNSLGQWKFEGLITHPVASTPMQITVRESDNLIWVSSTRDVLTAYRFKETPMPSLERLYSDERERAGRNHILIEDNFFLAADRDEGIIGLWMPPDRRTATNLTKVFEAYIPNSIAVLQAGNLRAPWKPRKQALPGIVRPDIDVIGTCFDGAIYHFTILTAAATDLLVYIQHKFLQLAYPQGHSRPVHLRELEMIKEGNIRHVNGTALAQALAHGTGWLQTVMEQDDGVLERLVVEMFFKHADGAAAGFLGPGTSTMADVVVSYLKELLGGVVL